MSVAVQVLVDVLAIVGGWNVGDRIGRTILRRRRRPPPAEIPCGALPTPRQYRPTAFEPVHNGPTIEEEIRNARR